jgi:hypothetical protein
LQPAQPLTGPADYRTGYAGIDSTASAAHSQHLRNASGEGYRISRIPDSVLHACCARPAGM